MKAAWVGWAAAAASPRQSLSHLSHLSRGNFPQKQWLTPWAASFLITVTLRGPKTILEQHSSLFSLQKATPWALRALQSHYLLEFWDKQLPKTSWASLAESCLYFNLCNYTPIYEPHQIHPVPFCFKHCWCDCNRDLRAGIYNLVLELESQSQNAKHPLLDLTSVALHKYIYCDIFERSAIPL